MKERERERKRERETARREREGGKRESPKQGGREGRSVVHSGKSYRSRALVTVQYRASRKLGGHDISCQGQEDPYRPGPRGLREWSPSWHGLDPERE